MSGEVIVALMPWLSAASTVLGLTVFSLIAWWAFSPKRRALNDEAARLPFDLPDEFSGADTSQQGGSR